MSRLLFAGMLALMLCACSNTGKEKEEITVLAAASMKDALEEKKRCIQMKI